MRINIDIADDVALNDILLSLEKFSKDNKEYISNISLEYDIIQKDNNPETDSVYNKFKDSLDQLSHELKDIDKDIQDYIKKYDEDEYA
jgi:hypothetical protein